MEKAAVSGLVASVAAAIVWLGGLSPGGRINEVDFRLTRLVDSLRITCTVGPGRQ